RELHEKLMSKQSFSTWIQRRIRNYGFVEGEDFFTKRFKNRHDGLGRPSTEYYFQLDTAKEIAMVEHTEQGRAVRKYFIEIERRYRQQEQPKTQAELSLMMAQQLVDQEKKINQLESGLNEANEKIENVSTIMALNPKEWRSEVNKIINSIAFKLGGEASYKDIRNESYQLLEKRAKCDLERRLSNRKRNMVFEGASKSKVEKINKMDVVEHDKRLTEIYLSIVKEMAIKYQVKYDQAIV
ncbi:MAG TPA: antA/AntB antirepressor family protein, partial [Bacillales bacterium]